MQRSSSFFWNCDESDDEDQFINTLEQINEYGDDTPTTTALAEEGEENGDFYMGPLSPQRNKKEEMRPILPSSVYPKQYNYNTIHSENLSIRFQVVIWYVGPIDVKLGHVPVRFRVTLFWNDVPQYNRTQHHDKHKSDWIMQGRKQAIQAPQNTSNLEVIDVPPISILNAVQFEIIGTPEISTINHETRLMRWTCLYNATLFQENMRVDKFPHDEHEITIQLGIVADRHYKKRWDCRLWKLALATEEDSQGSTRIPHGLLIDNVSIPDFIKSNELIFEFVPFQFGSSLQHNHDLFLQVKLPVFRESGHYDTNIMPLMAVMNIVAVTCLTRLVLLHTLQVQKVHYIFFFSFLGILLHPRQVQN